MSPFGSRAASLGTAWIWDPAAFRPRFVRTMPPLPKVGSRLPAVPAAAAAAEARPTARPSTNVPVNAAGVRFFTFLVLPGFLDCQPVAGSIQGATGAGSRSAGEAAWRAGQCAKSASSAPPASSPHHPSVRDAPRPTIGPRYRARSSTATGSPGTPAAVVMALFSGVVEALI